MFVYREARVGTLTRRDLNSNDDLLAHPRPPLAVPRGFRAPAHDVAPQYF